MYESFFGFERRPFSVNPLASDYFPAEIIENARITITRCIERSEGPTMLIGPVGTGKSLLCHVLAMQFNDRMKVCQLANSHLCSRRTLLQSILFELRLPYRDLPEGELRLSLIDYLTTSDECSNGLLMLIDEAHTVPIPLLDELRMITNLIRNGESRVRLLLAGLPQLEEQFAGPKLESFTQRIAARCYLEPVNREETARYVQHLVSRAGAVSDSVFNSSALQVIYDATNGIPRLINQLCDHALVMASIAGQRVLNDRGIQKAWTDLQQLPEPTLHEPYDSNDSAGGFIEFGSLLDEEENVSANFEENRSPSIDESIENPATQLKAITPYRSEDEETIRERASHKIPYDRSVNPPCSTTSENTSPLPNAENPFAESFNVEEIVLDRFPPFPTTTHDRCRVTCDEGRDITNLMTSSEPQMTLFTGAAGHDDLTHDTKEESAPLEQRVAAQLARTESMVANEKSQSPEDDFVGDPQLDVVPYQSIQEYSSQLKSNQHKLDLSETDPNRVDGLEPSDEERSVSNPEPSWNRPTTSFLSDALKTIASQPAIDESTSNRQTMELDNYDTNSPDDSAVDSIDVVMPEQRDLVVVEEDHADWRNTSHKTSRAHRQDYQQLFAKLRRG